MQVEQNKGISPPKPENASPSKVIKITPTTEPGFELENCFEGNVFVPEEGYIKDTDSYFDSYSHFAIHEEMLKDQARGLNYYDD